MKIKVGDVFDSNNYGGFKVVAYENYRNIEVEFIETGYRTTTHASQIRSGQVKDKLYPSVFGVGFIGDGEHLASLKRKLTKPYKAWCRMLQRCYSDSYQARYPTYKGCTVCKEWLNFQNFSEWFDKNCIEGYQIDKDIKIKGNKIYSPDACMFVSPADNVIEAIAKYYIFTDQIGNVHEIYNMSKFCKENGLDHRCMSEVHTGNRKHHKGWRKS